jgi:hypothetical protein
MKLLNFKNLGNYNFIFNFENGETKEANLYDLIHSKILPSDLDTAHIDSDWGCLEFKDGFVDIEPNTLYKFVNKST